MLLCDWSAVKELLGRSAAEMIYSTTLRLPGEFTEQYTVDAHIDLDNYSDKLHVAMSRLWLCPPRDTTQKHIFQYKELETCSYKFLRRIAIAPPLTAPYNGPYKVISRSNINPNERQGGDSHCWPRKICASASLSQITLHIAKRTLNQNIWLQSLLRSLENHGRTEHDPVAVPLLSLSGQ